MKKPVHGLRRGAIHSADRTELVRLRRGHRREVPEPFEQPPAPQRPDARDLIELRAQEIPPPQPLVVTGRPAVSLVRIRMRN